MGRRINVHSINEAMLQHRQGDRGYIDIKHVWQELLVLPDDVATTQYAKTVAKYQPMIDILTIRSQSDKIEEALCINHKQEILYSIIVYDNRVYDRRTGVFGSSLIPWLLKIEEQNTQGIQCDFVLSTYTFGLPNNYNI